MSLQGHHDEMFVLEAHPVDPYVFLSAGNIMTWAMQ